MSVSAASASASTSSGPSKDPSKALACGSGVSAASTSSEPSSKNGRTGNDVRYLCEPTGMSGVGARTSNDRTQEESDMSEKEECVYAAGVLTLHVPYWSDGASFDDDARVYVEECVEGMGVGRCVVIEWHRYTNRHEAAIQY